VTSRLACRPGVECLVDRNWCDQRGLGVSLRLTAIAKLLAEALKAVARVQIPSGLPCLTRPFPPGDGLVRCLWHGSVACRV